jgi:hypothetical protein
MSCFLAHQTAGLCPNKKPKGIKLSKPSQLIFLLSFMVILLRASSRYFRIKFFTLHSNCNLFVYCTALCGSCICCSQSFKFGWCYWNYLSCYSISFCKKIFKFVSSSGKAKPKALKYPLA